VIHLIFFQTSKGQNNFRSFVAKRNQNIYLKNEIPSKKHCSTCAIRLNKKMKAMPSFAQTGGSTESNASVLKHEKEELMDISSPQQDISDDDSVTVGS